MKLENAIRWSWMNVLTRKRLEILTELFGGADAAMDILSMELLERLGLRDDSAMKAMVRLEEFNLSRYLGVLQKKNIQMMSMEDEKYPASLQNVPDAPVFLYYRGDIAVLSQPCIAIVGSRDMSDYGRRVVGHLVPAIVRAGVITVSGLAYGIDAEVAKETLRSGGRTVAVLGHGLGMIYPKANEKLADDIAKSGGLILSEFPLDTQPDKFSFPARNRIIAGLSICTVVAEAAEDSGSLITADLALDYGRDVCAVPGDLFHPQYAGCHRLIARGLARLVVCGEDVLQEAGIIGPSTTPASAWKADSPDEQRVFDSVSSLPSALDDLVVKTALDAATLNGVLTVLELKGAVKNVGGGRWVRA